VTDVDIPFGDIVSENDAVLLRAGKKRFRRIAIV
jgi:hypothetical protein